MRTFLSTSCSSWPTSKPSDWKQAGHYNNPLTLPRCSMTTSTTTQNQQTSRWRVPNARRVYNQLLGRGIQLLVWNTQQLGCGDQQRGHEPRELHLYHEIGKNTLLRAILLRQVQKQPGLIKKERRWGTARTKTSSERTRIDQKRTPTRYGKYQDKSRKNPDRS